ncbi:hypothetical protein BX666DRAFT_1877034 [Dichotomocladium elegans]|nr:hypothetical protein BX666DRAFT_1877034 [Dichotomocladium elegans]
MDEHKQPEQGSPISPKQFPSSSPEVSEIASPSSHVSSPRGNETSGSTHDVELTQDQQQQQQQQEQEPHSISQPPPPEQQQPQLSEPIRTLKEAFPDIDIEIIEAILASQNGQMERSFEVLLGMSDPNYTPEAPPRPQQHQSTDRRAPEAVQAEEDDMPAPPMPPRPTRASPPSSMPFSFWEQQQQQQQQQPRPRPQEPPVPRTVEEQMAMDEAYARQLALEDERARAQQYRRMYPERNSQRQQEEDDRPLFNFQEDLPVIKERVIEAGNAAKKKVLDLYSQFKASRANSGGGVSGSGQTSIPTTNVQYRGLPSDDGDDLLAGDVSALHLSDNDVYAQTRSNQAGVNSPYPRSGNSPVNAQILADEELARRLARDDQFWDGNAQASPEARGGQTPTRRASPFASQHSAIGTDLEGDSVLLSAPDTKHAADAGVHSEERKSYVIRDEDDSDDDDLIDVDDDDRSDVVHPSGQKIEEKSPISPK